MVWDGHLPVNKISPMQVQHIDIAPTICDLLKIKKPALFEGQSLLSIFDGRKLFPHPVFSEHQERQGDVSSGAWVYSKYSVRRDNWKLIYTLHPKGKAYELYNLKDDPSELNNLNRASILTEKEKTEFEILKQELAVWSRRKKPKVRPAARSLDERTKEKLKGLGYLN
jgi:arylsulfatase A-like enzyme